MLIPIMMSPSVALGTSHQAKLLRDIRNKLNAMFEARNWPWVSYTDFSFWRVLPNYTGPRPGTDAGCGLPRRVLFEGPVSGSGQTTDWDMAAGLARRIEVILAGGLNPLNVAAAIRHVRPFGVDVSSGVESAPGLKDTAKIAQFVAAARSAATELNT